MQQPKRMLSFSQIVNMNIGFFGIQFSFGLQQSNMSPIYSYLGAHEASLPILLLAGPVTGLIVQPIVGAMSDRTISRWGRRTPYFLVGAILCSIGLLSMPFSPTLWMAASLLWILDAANNITMEPYRAFVSDKLNPEQHTFGFLTQSAFTGLAQTLAYMTPSLLVVFGMNKDTVNASHIPHIVISAFLIGSLFSIATIVWTVTTTPEDRLRPEQLRQIRSRPAGWQHTFNEILAAVREMPCVMKQLALVKLFQWYAMVCYWQYITLSLAHTVYGSDNPASQGFRDAGLLTGKLGAFYNFIAFLAAFALVPFSRRFGPKLTHGVSLTLAGIGMLSIPMIANPALLPIPMLGIGVAWASIMGNPYVLLAGCIPPERTGVYMGIFNMFIVIPMIIQAFTLPLLYRTWLGGSPENVIRLAGGLLLCASVAVLFVKVKAPRNMASLPLSEANG
ncbi:MFS transporter [Massilia cellulosiltytica]|uniref:MFS transporter n=1 Tax=Massilia cellulosiltytica TaxID=2683234 RepID=UPI0039B5F56E